MKPGTYLFSFALMFLAVAMQAQSVIVLPGGPANGGSLETTINNDTRTDENLIYELERGQFYMMHGPINVDVGNRSITIRAVAGEGPKPVIIRVPLNEVPVGQNVIKGSLVMQNLQYHVMQTDGAISGGWGHFLLQGNDNRLVIENCLIEMCAGSFSNTDAIENGGTLIFRNNYFRDFHSGSQWWGGRIVNCKVPVDTLVFEGNTCTGAGLTVLGQECMFEYAMINHNTFINNTKYPFLNQYWKECYFANNLFVNANWVGEDMENVATGGQDPDARLHGLVGVDTITSHIWINSKFYANPADSTGLRDDIDEISDYIWYAADNVCVASETLNDYYAGIPDDGITGAPASYLNWGGLGSGPWKVLNVPGIFMNSRTEALVNDWDNIKAENNSVYEHTAEELGFGTDPLPAAAAAVYIDWNRAQWGVPGVAAPDLAPTRFGDYDANTIPGVETEDSDAGGITKISDMLEDFSYAMKLTSHIDGYPIGALHWDDIPFDSEELTARVKAAYLGTGVEEKLAEVSSGFELKNYPNPFSVHTTISFRLESDSYVSLEVYDIQGRRIATLLDEARPRGVQNVEFSPGSSASCTCLLKLTTDLGSETRKMMMLQ